MTDEEFRDKCPLFPSFQNFTKAMYEGNEPCGKGHNLVSGGKSDRWSTMYGGGETHNDEIIHANFSISPKITIYIVGNKLFIEDIRYSGKSDVWEYSNCRESLNCPIAPQYLHELEVVKIKNILNTRIDNCKFWNLVRERAKELYKLAHKSVS